LSGWPSPTLSEVKMYSFRFSTTQPPKVVPKNSGGLVF
jgi:hypothetical protein